MGTMLRHALRRAARIKGRPLSEAAAVATPKVPQAPPPPVDDDAALTPRKICDELDTHIVGQDAAKRAVAIALRNRWRRQLLGEELRAEVVPKNILMIGPTGCGKTEIARRLSKLANAPFVKVEATKFTEVGYVGRDVDSIIRDLVDMSIKMHREQEKEKVKFRAQDAAEERILDALLPPARGSDDSSEKTDSTTRQIFRKKLR